MSRNVTAIPRQLALFMVILCVIGVVAIAVTHYYNMFLSRTKMRAIASAIVGEYRMDRSFPAEPGAKPQPDYFNQVTLEELTDWTLPWTHWTLFKRGRNASHSSPLKYDYVYLNWERMTGIRHFTPPPEYPLLYNARLINAGRGVYVVTFGEKLFWDPQTHYLLDFVEKHPEFTIPLPR